MCPITSHVRPFPTSVVLPSGLPVTGEILTSHIRSIDATARTIRYAGAKVPLEIAQYAEGQRTVAFFMLNQVADGDKKVPQYLVVLTDPRDGLPFDYDQVRVFTWNVKHHRYETAYRERGLNGVLPVTVSQESFDKEGLLPVFVLRVTNDDGKVSERKYKMNTPIVRTVLAPGEVMQKPSVRKKRR